MYSFFYVYVNRILTNCTYGYFLFQYWTFYLFIQNQLCESLFRLTLRLAPWGILFPRDCQFKKEDKSMELIAKITDKEIGEDVVKYEKLLTRVASRGIVLNDNGKIAIFYKKNKNEYKLPGGGMK